MGFFNVLRVNEKCPFCGVLQQMDVQFKYGEVRQHQYRLGDTIRPGSGDVASDEPQTIRGTTDCSVCDTKHILCDIHFKRFAITHVVLFTAVEPVCSPALKGVRGKHGRGKRAKHKKR